MSTSSYNFYGSSYHQNSTVKASTVAAATITSDLDSSRNTQDLVIKVRDTDASGSAIAQTKNIKMDASAIDFYVQDVSGHFIKKEGLALQGSSSTFQFNVDASDLSFDAPNRIRLEQNQHNFKDLYFDEAGAASKIEKTDASQNLSIITNDGDIRMRRVAGDVDADNTEITLTQFDASNSAPLLKTAQNVDFHIKAGAGGSSDNHIIADSIVNLARDTYITTDASDIGVKIVPDASDSTSFVQFKNVASDVQMGVQTGNLVVDASGGTIVMAQDMQLVQNVYKITGVDDTDYDAHDGADDALDIMTDAAIRLAPNMTATDISDDSHATNALIISKEDASAIQLSTMEGDLRLDPSGSDSKVHVKSDFLVQGPDADMFYVDVSGTDASATIIATDGASVSSMKIQKDIDMVADASFNVDVGGNMTQDVSGSLTETVDGAVLETYNSTLDTDVAGNMSLDVSGTLTETVDGAVLETYNSTLDTDVAGNMTLDVSGTMTETITGDATFVYDASEIKTVAGNSSLTVSGALTENVTGDATFDYDASEIKTVAGNSSLTVSGALAENVTGDATFDYDASEIKSVAGNVSLDVSGSLTETVDGAVLETYNSTLDTDVAGNMSLDVSGTMTETVDGLASMTYGAGLVEQVTGPVTVTYTGTETKQVTENLVLTIDGDMTETVRGDVAFDYDASETKTVAGNMSLDVSGTLAETVDGAVTETYNSTLDTDVAGNMTLDVSGSLTETVDGAVLETYNSTLDTDVAGNMSLDVSGTLTETVDGAVTETYKSNLSTDVTGTTSITTSTHMTLTANDTMTMQGQNQTSIKSITDKVLIDAQTDVDIDASQNFTMNADGTSSIESVGLSTLKSSAGTVCVDGQAIVLKTGDVTVKKNLFVEGDLNVQGTTNQLAETQLNVEDKTITLASAETGNKYVYFEFQDDSGSLQYKRYTHIDQAANTNWYDASGACINVYEGVTYYFKEGGSTLGFIGDTSSAAANSTYVDVAGAEGANGYFEVTFGSPNATDVTATLPEEIYYVGKTAGHLCLRPYDEDSMVTRDGAQNDGAGLVVEGLLPKGESFVDASKNVGCAEKSIKWNAGSYGILGFEYDASTPAAVASNVSSAANASYWEMKGGGLQLTRCIHGYAWVDKQGQRSTSNSDVTVSYRFEIDDNESLRIVKIVGTDGLDSTTAVSGHNVVAVMGMHSL